MLPNFHFTDVGVSYGDVPLETLSHYRHCGDAFLQVSGGEGISVMLPKWSPDDKLLYINDKTNWWNLYQLEDDNKETNLCPQPKEIGQPAWKFGGSPYSCNPNGNGDILVIHGSV